MILKRFSIYLILLVALTGCKEELTREKAKEIIIAYSNPVVLNADEANSSFASLGLLKTDQGYRLGIAQEDLAQIYEKIGFIEQYSFQNQPYVRLTEKGKKKVREIFDPERTLDLFALSNRRMVDWRTAYAFPKIVDVTGISADSETTATIQVHDVWEPNELGKAIQEVKKKDKAVIGVPYLPVDIYATGKMRYYDDGWRLESLEANNYTSSPSGLLK